jgi:hypothetical protein
MKVITAPKPIDDAQSVFLAGGITGCPDWQAEVIYMLDEEGFDGTVYNPRRANFPIGDPTAASEQIAWEFAALERADVRLFWFAGGERVFPESALRSAGEYPGAGARYSSPVQPIALYELGRWTALEAAPLVVGADPNYARLIDVHEQMRHARPDLAIHPSLAGVVEATLAIFG